MESYAEALRRRIALYEEYLSQGQDLQRANIYLQGIREAKAELAEIERREKESKKPLG